MLDLLKKRVLLLKKLVFNFFNLLKYLCYEYIYVKVKDFS